MIEFIFVYLVIGATVAAIKTIEHCDEIIESFDRDNLPYVSRLLAVALANVYSTIAWPTIIASNIIHKLSK